MESEQSLSHEELDSLAELFDLLARFDFEDKRREESMPKTDPLTPAPGGQF